MNYAIASSKIVSLTVEVADEYTYFAADKPLLAGAIVTLTDDYINFQETLIKNASGMIKFF